MYAHGLVDYSGRWSDRRATVRADALHADRRALRRPARKNVLPAVDTPSMASSHVDIIALIRERPWIAALSAGLVALAAGVSIAIAASNAVLRDIAKPVTLDSDTAAGIAQALVDEQNLTDTSRAPKIASPAFLAAVDTSETLPADLGRQAAATTSDFRSEPAKAAQPQRFYDEVQPVDRGVQINANNGGSIVIHWADEKRSRNTDRTAENSRQAEPRAPRDELF